MSDRTSCGTYLGMRLHIDLGEPLCPDCAHIALAKSLAAERRHTQPPTEPAHIRDLRAVIAVLADAMSSKANQPLASKRSAKRSATNRSTPTSGPRRSAPPSMYSST